MIGILGAVSPEFRPVQLNLAAFREALGEMRRMVGVLRRSDSETSLAPQPSLQQLDRLVEHARDAGVAVDLHIEGVVPRLAPGVDRDIRWNMLTRCDFTVLARQ